MKTLLCVICILVLSACSGTGSHEYLSEKGGARADDFLSDVEDKLCNFPTIGSIKRRYGPDQQKYKEYLDFCNHTAPIE